MDRENVIGILSQFKTHIFGDKIYGGSVSVEEIIALLKEHENQKQHWLKQIADTQHLNAPDDWQNDYQKLYAKGVWDGLQIAWDIISEGR